MKEIKLTQGKVALVDDDDFERVSSIKWCADVKGGGTLCYARGYSNGKMISMHQFITGNKMTDHRDGNGLNNIRSNLRSCTPSENQYNKGKCRNNTTGYKGVTFEPRRNKFKAAIRRGSNPINLGRFNTAIEAARAYDAKAREIHGEFAQTNFRE